MITAMMNRALAIVGNPVLDFKKRTFKDIEAKKDAAILALFRRAMGTPRVQHVIADIFDGSTPMCRVLERAIENGIDEHGQNNEIDADNVKNLDCFVEQEIENFARYFEVDAENVKHLDETVGSIIESHLKEVKEEIIEGIVDELVRRMTCR